MSRKTPYFLFQRTENSVFAEYATYSWVHNIFHPFSFLPFFWILWISSPLGVYIGVPGDREGRWDIMKNSGSILLILMCIGVFLSKESNAGFTFISGSENNPISYQRTQRNL